MSPTGSALAALTEGEEWLATVEHTGKRAWLKSYARTGNKSQACRAAGISQSLLYMPQWRDDHEFQRLLRIAESAAADRLEEEAVRRAVEGEVKYRFHPKTGAPLRHPDICECGSMRTEHERLPDATDEETGRSWARWGGLGACTGYVGIPYVEVERSDRLLEFLLKGLKRERYGARVEVAGELGLYRALAQIPPDAAEELLAMDDDELRAYLDRAAREE